MRILNKEYDNILFVHIPKTAGTSIFKILHREGLDHWKRTYPRGHDPYFSLKQDNAIDDSVFSFCVVRNPYTRTYSCFKQFNKTNKTNISFLQYLKNIKDNKISTKTPLLHLPQSFYSIDQDGGLQVNKAYRFEDLGALESDFGWELSLSNAGNYMVELYSEDYTKEAVELTQELYGLDFVNFGYSTDFTMSLGER
jgi:hypothetical protein